MDLQHLWNIVYAFFADGFREGFAQVNAVLGLIIAIVAAYMMHAWKRIFALALGATVVHLVAQVMIPFLANQTAFHLPANLLTVSYWQAGVALYLGYLLVIAIFFFLKTHVLKGGGGGHH